MGDGSSQKGESIIARVYYLKCPVCNRKGHAKKRTNNNNKKSSSQPKQKTKQSGPSLIRKEKSSQMKWSTSRP
jgi:hypothetical protein